MFFPLVMAFSILCSSLMVFTWIGADTAQGHEKMQAVKREEQSLKNYGELVRTHFKDLPEEALLNASPLHARICDTKIYVGRCTSVLGAVNSDLAFGDDGSANEPLGRGFTAAEVISYGLLNALDFDPVRGTYTLIVWGNNLSDGGRALIDENRRGTSLGIKETNGIRSYNYRDVVTPTSAAVDAAIPNGTIVLTFKPRTDTP